MTKLEDHFNFNIFYVDDRIRKKHALLLMY